MGTLFFDPFAASKSPTLLVVGSVIATLIAWGVGTAIYNLFFHPLARFPGPRSAAISQRWLRNVSLTGRQEAIFEELHKKYGSRTLRIGPNELHISDPKLYKTIYSQDGQYLKEPYFYNAFPSKSDLFTARSDNIHKERRAMMDPCFSRTALLKKQNILHGVLEKMQRRLEKRGHDRLVNLNNLCRLFPADVVLEFAFGETYDSMTKSDDDFNTPLLRFFDLANGNIWARMFPSLAQWMEKLIPSRLLTPFVSDTRVVKDWLGFVMDRVIKYQTRLAEKTTADDDLLLDSIKDLQVRQKHSEAITIIAAGSDTTGVVLSYACWQLARDDTLCTRLVQELDDIYRSAGPNAPDLPALESSPLLTAIVKESLRCGIAVPGRLPRIVPEQSKTPLTVDGVVIPPGTTVGISSTSVHFAEELWGSDARQFRPDRWLEPDGMAKPSNLVAFSRGARNCIGQNLAMNELYTFLAFVFHTYKIKLMAGPKELHMSDTFTAHVTEPYYVTLTPRIHGKY